MSKKERFEIIKTSAKPTAYLIQDNFPIEGASQYRVGCEEEIEAKICVAALNAADRSGYNTQVYFYECPSCKHRTPVSPSLDGIPESITKRIEAQDKIIKDIQEEFDKTLEGIAEYIPEAKMYLHNREQNIINSLKELKNEYKINRRQLRGTTPKETEEDPSWLL
jgi:hypothetical protein